MHIHDLQPTSAATSQSAPTPDSNTGFPSPLQSSHYTEEQIIGILKQHEAGMKAAELCREHGISAATFYGWKSKYEAWT